MTRPINVVVLGATGSVGQQTLDVIDRNPARLRLFGLTEGRRSTQRKAEYLVQGQAGDADFDARVEAMVTDPRCDIVVVAIPGARALAPTMAALKAGKTIALATKEVLVMAGDLVMHQEVHMHYHHRGGVGVSIVQFGFLALQDVDEVEEIMRDTLLSGYDD